MCNVAKRKQGKEIRIIASIENFLRNMFMCDGDKNKIKSLG